MEAGAVSGVEDLLRPHPKPTPGGPQGFMRLNGSHPGGVARSRSTWRRLERIQDPNLTRAGRALDVPVPQVSRTLYDPQRVAWFEGDM